MKFKQATLDNASFNAMVRSLDRGIQQTIRTAFTKCSGNAHKDYHILQARKRIRIGMEYFAISVDPWINAYKGRIRKESDPEPTLEQKTCRVTQAFISGNLRSLISVEARRSDAFNEADHVNKLFSKLEAVL